MLLSRFNNSIIDTSLKKASIQPQEQMSERSSIGITEPEPVIKFKLSQNRIHYVFFGFSEHNFVISEAQPPHRNRNENFSWKIKIHLTI